ncbi:hypothetical protein [Arthrobacter sp. MAHUQ-56]
MNPAATNEIPKLYESGWDWWAWPLAWAALAATGLLIALAVPAAHVLFSRHAGRFWTVPTAALALLAGLAAVVLAWLAPGILMRHMDSGGGVFLVFLGCLALAGAVWYLAARIIESTIEPAYDWTGRTVRWRAWNAAAPAVVLTAATIFGGIAEAVTRAAASIPMGVAQLLGLVASVLLLGIFWITLRAVKR